MDDRTPLRLTRRHLFGMSAAWLALGGRAASAQNRVSADEALKRLMDGNARFSADPNKAYEDDLRVLKEKSTDKQEPFAAVLACADSRVPVEIAFDQSIGHLFVNRVAGNVASGEIMASLEYGVAVLGIRLIMVLGHENCGAVSATIAMKDAPGQISSLYRHIRPAVDRAGTNLDAAIRANARLQAGLLKTSSPVIAGAIGRNEVKVVAAYYRLSNGQVSLLE